jgi:uncharacterized membrane protein YhaH (DUF805 family)
MIKILKVVKTIFIPPLRINRMHFLMRNIFWLVLSLVVYNVTTTGAIVSEQTETIIFGFCILLYVIMTLLNNISRLHDLDMSGWNVLPIYIPYLGGIFALWLLFGPGTKGANRFGDTPDTETETSSDAVNNWAN